jgi:hypothetical protein
MGGTVVCGPRRLEERDAPAIVQPTEVIVRIACPAGSVAPPRHECDRAVDPDGARGLRNLEEASKAVTSIKPGQFVMARSLPLTTAVRTAYNGYHPPANSRELTDLLEAATIFAWPICSSFSMNAVDHDLRGLMTI